MYGAQVRKTLGFFFQREKEMVLEATVVCLDNSEWMRNGDYAPTRLEAQNDAANLLCSVKIEQNPENTVGVMTMAGSGCPQVLVTPTQDIGKILTCLHEVKVGGETNFKSSIQIAQLCLKYRQNKHQKQRVVAFVGSPLTCSTSELVTMGKKLKKMNVAVDVVSFGEEGENTEKLEQFINAVNSQENSRLITVPPGPHILSDIILRSPLLSSDEMGGGGGGGAMGVGAAGGGGGGGGAGGFDFDPNLDPELAMALRISLEEERARIAEAEKLAAQQAGGSSTETSSSAAAPSANPATSSSSSSGGGGNDLMEDEEALLQQAMALSMQTAAQERATAVPPTSSSAPSSSATEETNKGGGDTEMADLDDDEAMQLALQMSMQGADSSAPAAPAASSAAAAPAGDADFLRGVLTNLPGLDANDERVKAALAAIGGTEEKKKDEEGKKEEEEKK